jgi:hypothetical protein
MEKDELFIPRDIGLFCSDGIMFNSDFIGELFQYFFCWHSLLQIFKKANFHIRNDSELHATV